MNKPENTGSNPVGFSGEIPPLFGSIGSEILYPPEKNESVITPPPQENLTPATQPAKKRISQGKKPRKRRQTSHPTNNTSTQGNPPTPKASDATGNPENSSVKDISSFSATSTNDLIKKLNTLIQGNTALQQENNTLIQKNIALSKENAVLYSQVFSLSTENEGLKKSNISRKIISENKRLDEENTLLKVQIGRDEIDRRKQYNALKKIEETSQNKIADLENKISILFRLENSYTTCFDNTLGANASAPTTAFKSFSSALNSSHFRKS